MKYILSLLILISSCKEHSKEIKQEPLVDMGNGWLVAESLYRQLEALKPGDSLTTRTGVTYIKPMGNDTLYSPPNAYGMYWKNDTLVFVDTTHGNYMIDSVDGDLILGNKIINNNYKP